MASGRGQVIQFRALAPSDTTAPSQATGRVSRVGLGDTEVNVRVSSAGSSPLTAQQQLTIQDLGNGSAFIHPLYLAVEQVAGEWFVVSPDLALVGRGESDFEALEDVRQQIAELFESLQEMRPTLGPHLRNQLAFLERLAGLR